jgi:hypothetical protein
MLRKTTAPDSIAAQQETIIANIRVKPHQKKPSAAADGFSMMDAAWRFAHQALN